MEELSSFSLIVISIAAFLAGFIDAVVGGGGLVQLPALLINLPKMPLPTLFGTNKISALAGTSVAAYQYSTRVKFDYRLLILSGISCFVASYLGAKTVSFLNPNLLKPLILLILILVFIYTLVKKDLGNLAKSNVKNRNTKAVLLGFIVGFYDGFFGPGTGSFFVLGFVTLLGFAFLEASAYAKILNCLTNISALLVFIKSGNYILGLAVIMAAANISGNVFGARMALKKGNGFIRVIFMLVVGLMILRYGYDIVKGLII